MLLPVRKGEERVIDGQEYVSLKYVEHSYLMHDIDERLDWVCLTWRTVDERDYTKEQGESEETSAPGSKKEVWSVMVKNN